MSLLRAIRTIEKRASEQKSIHTLVRGDIFKINERTDIHYGAFAWVQQVHRMRIERGVSEYHFILYYIDRLTADKSNTEEVQSVGFSTLQNILRTLPEDWSIAEVEVHPFNYRFVDECAGVWADVKIQVAEDDLCGETYEEEADFNIDFNGDFLIID